MEIFDEKEKIMADLDKLITDLKIWIETPEEEKTKSLPNPL